MSTFEKFICGLGFALTPGKIMPTDEYTASEVLRYVQRRTGGTRAKIKLIEHDVVKLVTEPGIAMRYRFMVEPSAAAEPPAQAVGKL